MLILVFMSSFVVQYGLSCLCSFVFFDVCHMAVDDDLLNKNPFDFQLKTVIANDSETREAITAKQEQSFLDFIINDTHYCKYYDGIFILFKTGLHLRQNLRQMMA